MSDHAADLENGRNSCFRKKRYGDIAEAERVARGIYEKREVGGVLRAYECTLCGGAHLTRDLPHAVQRHGPDRESWIEVKRQVYERDGGRCRLCNTYDGAVDDDGDFVELIYYVLRHQAQTADEVLLMCRACKDTAIEARHSAAAAAAYPDRTPDALAELVKRPPEPR